MLAPGLQPSVLNAGGVRWGAGVNVEKAEGAGVLASGLRGRGDPGPALDGVKQGDRGASFRLNAGDQGLASGREAARGPALGSTGGIRGTRGPALARANVEAARGAGGFSLRGPQEPAVGAGMGVHAG